MSRKVKEWLKSYPSGDRLVKVDFPTFALFLHGGGKMSRKVKKWLKSYPIAGRLVKMDVSIPALSFPTWRWEMCRKVEKWLKRYPDAGRLVKMNFRTFSLFLHGGGR